MIRFVIIVASWKVKASWSLNKESNVRINIDTKVDLEYDPIGKAKKTFLISFCLLTTFFVLKLVLAKVLLMNGLVSTGSVVFFSLYSLLFNIWGFATTFLFLKFLYLKYKFKLNPKIFKI